MGKLRGSALLNLLHHRSGSVAGDGQAHRLLHKLLHAAFTPYFRYPLHCTPLYCKDLHMVSATTSQAGPRLCLMIMKGSAQVASIVLPARLLSWEDSHATATY